MTATLYHSSMIPLRVQLAMNYVLQGHCCGDRYQNGPQEYIMHMQGKHHHVTFAAMKICC